MRRDGTVIDFERMCDSSNTWRNLADFPIGVCSQSAEKAGYPLPCVTRSNSGLLAQERSGLRSVRTAMGHDRRHDQQRQAASRRVKSNCHPGRNRQCEGPTRRHQPNHRRHQNHSSKHVLQPLREEQDQRARPAWQECGRPWENLRRPLRGFRRCNATTMRGDAAATRSGCGWDVRQPLDVWPGLALQGSGNALKDMGNCMGSVVGAWCRRDGSCCLWAGSSLDAAIWRETGGLDWPRTPEVTDDCLSFVIRDQQGAHVAVCEDDL